MSLRTSTSNYNPSNNWVVFLFFGLSCLGIITYIWFACFGFRGDFELSTGPDFVTHEDASWVKQRFSNHAASSYGAIYTDIQLIDESGHGLLFDEYYLLGSYKGVECESPDCTSKYVRLGNCWVLGVPLARLIGVVSLIVFVIFFRFVRRIVLERKRLG